MKTTEVNLNDLSSIQYRYFIADIPKLKYKTTLIIEFSGACGFGSSSNKDARFMEAVISAGFRAWDPCCCIIDLRNLRYQWGDMMLVLFNPPHEMISGTDEEFEFPFAAVISDLNREGFNSLVSEEMFADPTKLLFNTIENATARVIEIANKT